MNIKTEFEQYLAVKAEEFVSQRTNMTIIEFRELNAVLDTCGIDFNNLPTLISIPATKPIKRSKSLIKTSQVIDFVLSSMTGGNMVSMKELYQSIDTHFEGQLTEIDNTKNTGGMRRIQNRVYTAVRDLRQSGKVDQFLSKNGKIYFHRVRSSSSPQTHQQSITL